MKSVEWLNDRIKNAEDFIEKKNGTIEKNKKSIEKKKAQLKEFNFEYPENFGGVTVTSIQSLGYSREEAHDIYWIVCDIVSYYGSIRDKERDIAEKQKALDSYRDELAKVIEKENSRNITVILDFLDNWKKTVFEYYDKALIQYYKEKAEVDKLRDKCRTYDYSEEDYMAYRDALNALNAKVCGEYEEQKVRYSIKKVKIKNGEWEFLKSYVYKADTLKDTENLIKKELDAEANDMYDDIINRTNDIVGQITDASYLHIGLKGDLNGYIIGTRGKASVETIGAGGYNIQRYHFRTLIKPIR